MQKNILIATHGLDIGGCETYIVTMVRELRKRGHNIVIAANDGTFRKYLESIGAKIEIINFFDRTNTRENIEKIKDIIKQYNITDVCIHPFYPFFEAVVASIETRTPYDLFFHGVSLEGYFDVKESFRGLGVWSDAFINNVAAKYARKYIYVSQESRNFYENTFKFNREKGIMLANSVELDENSNSTGKLEKFLTLARIDYDKLDSIKCGIRIYKRIFEKKENKNEMCLDIVGGGTKVDELEKYIKEDKEKYHINVLPATNNSYATIKKYDAVIGMGRTIIEAMGSKKIPILITYNNYIGLVDAGDKERTKKIAYTNFSGRNVEPFDEEKDLLYIENLREQDITNIVESNYNYIVENRNIEKNILEYINILDKEYKIKDQSIEELNDHLRIIQSMNNLELENKNSKDIIQKNNMEYEKNLKIQKQEIDELKISITNKNEENKNLNERIDKKNIEIKELQNTNRQQADEIEKYKNMLNNIYNKKSYKAYKAVRKILKIKK